MGNLAVVIVLVVFALGIWLIGRASSKRKADQARVQNLIESDPDLHPLDLEYVVGIGFRLIDRWEGKQFSSSFARESTGVSGFVFTGIDPPDQTSREVDGGASQTDCCALVRLRGEVPHTLIERARLRDRVAVATGSQDLEIPDSIPQSEKFNDVYRIRCNDDPRDAIALLDGRVVEWLLGDHTDRTRFRIELKGTWALCSYGRGVSKPRLDETLEFAEAMTPLGALLLPRR